MPMFYFIGYIEYLHIIIQNIFFFWRGGGGGGGVYITFNVCNLSLFINIKIHS